MKKFLVGFILGISIFFTTQVFADSVSKIGKKVDSEVSIYLDDKQVSNAIVLEGTSYVPVRELSELLGVEVEFQSTKEEKKIMLSSKLSWDDVVKTSDVKANIDTAQKNIDRLNEYIEYNTKLLETEKNDTYITFLEKEISKSQTEIVEWQDNLTQYKNELNELESTK